ncbi:glycosyl hydrolase family 18 protein [Vallitalea guaymasensis]|uniref:glycosyl hydrolase family 18 protein n=1 Tax=Vallitalea guaymasensis TaxID=1185412 RepID=UPI00272CEDA9|nr:glycosyl hydrolase family 18 protein [Vallitalea guaymasensis]
MKKFHNLMTLIIAVLLLFTTITCTSTQAQQIDEWQAGVSYSVGDLVTYNGTVYECRQNHTSLVGWEPPNVQSLWLETTTPGPGPGPGPGPNPNPGPGPSDLERVVVGYWHNFDNGSGVIRLKDVTTDFNVVNVAFAEPAGDTYTMAFSPFNATDAEFKSDIQELKARGTKVLISIGGSNGTVELLDNTAKQTFISTMINIIETYGFDGMDIDLEGSSLSLDAGDTDFTNPTTNKVVNLIDAITAIRNHFGNDFVLTMAPETVYVQGGYSTYGGSWGAYLPVIYALRSELDYIHVQHYNSGSMVGLDGMSYTQGTADFQVAMAEMLLNGFPVGNNPNNVFPALREDQIAIGIPACSNAAGGGYINNTEMKKALDYIVKGQSFNGQYQLQKAEGYPDLRGIMTWSINWDAYNNYNFSTFYSNYFSALGIINPTPTPPPAGKRIVAYYPEWGAYAGHNQYAPSDIPWDKVTHINYAFADIKNGEIACFDEWAAKGIAFGEPWDSPYKGCLGQFKKLKQQHPNTNILISVGGWSRSAEFHNVAATQASREKFALSVVDFLREWNFDGVDIDWEYPTFYRAGDTVDNPNDLGTPYATPDEKQTFTLLLQQLRTTLDQAGAADGKYYYVTTAVGCGKDKIDQTEPNLYAQYVDFINVMTYDMHGAWEGITGHQSPMYFDTNAENAYRSYFQTLYTDPAEVEANVELAKNYTVHEAMEYLKTFGIPADKLVLGSPFYSRGWAKVQNNGPISTLPGLYATCSGTNHTGTYGAHGIWDGGRYAGNNPYYNMISKEQDNSFQKYRDPVSKVPYLYSESKGEMYTYEDAVSLQEKIDYVINNNYGGIIFWELTGDYVAATGTNKGGTGELVNLLYNGLLGP